MRLLKMGSRLGRVITAVMGAMLVMSAAAHASVSSPRLTAPKDRAVVKSLPAFTWRPVRKAAEYQIEFSSTPSFATGVADIAAGPVTVTTTGYTNTEPIPNGTYYWRVRAVSATGVGGRWSRIRRITKRWNTAPKLLSPIKGAKVNWPDTPVMLRWSSVPYAVNYQLEIGTTRGMTTLAYGPVDVQGPDSVVPATLAPGTYYWLVRPIDAAGNTGKSSAIQSFTLAWPSSTSVHETDVSPDPDYQEPSFSWAPIPGASSYEIQVSTDPSFPLSSTIIDQTNWSGTSYTASHFYPNHTAMYWRVRAQDSQGDAGSWTDGQSFTDVFDQQTPQNFHNVTASGSIDDGDLSDSNPILRWSPVPGASHYLLSFAPWSPGTGCNFNALEPIQSTTNTAWTPGGWPPGATSPGQAVSDLPTYANWQHQEYGWTGAALSGNNYLMSGGAWCVSLIAVRADAPLVGSAIESAPTVLGSLSAPAFDYQPATATGTLTSGTTVSGGELLPPAYGSTPVAGGSTLSTTPLIEWNPVPTADGYYVIISNDAQFDSNAIVTGGFTNTDAWAPPVPLQDQTGAYWWEVIPVSSQTNGGEPQTLGGATDGGYAPAAFNKNSRPPSPIAPISGANASGMPTFSWHSAQGAVSYTLEISTDPTFASPIETDTTDATSYSAGATLPGGVRLYWRVRANDESYNLNWSPAQTFTHNMPVPQPASKPTRGATIPTLSWAPVAGATSYNLTITSGGASTTQSSTTPYFTPTEFFSPGTTTWKVQSVFPGGGTSAYSASKSYRRTIPPPSRIRAKKSGSRIIVTWKPDAIAKNYSVQLSTSSEFSSPIVNTTTANTSWVPNITPQQAAVKLYWRVAVVDDAGTVGSYHTGIFRHRG